MSPEEMHALEKAALTDPFLADALEGYRHAKDPSVELGQLRQQLAEKVSPSAPLPRIGAPKTYWWKIAASIVVVGGLSYLTYQFLPKNTGEVVAAEDSKKTERTNPAADTSLLPDTGIGKESNESIVNSGQTPKQNKAIEVTTAPTLDHLADSLENRKNMEEAKAAETREGENLSLKEKTAAAPARSDSAGQLSARSKGVLDEAKSATVPVSANKKEQAEGFFKNEVKQQSSNDKGKKARPILYRSRVVDNNQNAVPYANVVNLGNNANTLADRNGYFTITATTDSLVLLNVSSQGFQAREFRLNRFNRKSEDLVLYETPEDSEPAEVSVVAELDEPAFQENDKKYQAPTPTAGWILYNQQIANNLTRDRDALSRGEVILAFNISKSGKPTNIRVVRSLSGVNDSEAIRLLREGPEWSGASRSGDVRIIFRFK